MNEFKVAVANAYKNCRNNLVQWFTNNSDETDYEISEHDLFIQLSLLELTY